jgi:replication fork clamp-binding protein CrfC
MKESLSNISNSPEFNRKIASSNIIDNSFQRKDCFGNIISRKIKKHKICFPDNLDNRRQIAEIQIVTSYKQFYETSIYLLT